MELNINEILQPETQLETEIITDPEFIEGALWGKSRRGHPEGKVAFHIREVLDNIDIYSTVKNREDLRLIALIHDTFKHKVNIDRPKSGENHHAMIARRFAEKYTNDKVVLTIIELHDEAYNAWSKGDRDNKWEQADKRCVALIEKLEALDKDALHMYSTFYQCDNETGNKGQDNLVWFQAMILG